MMNKKIYSLSIDWNR